MRLIVAVFVLGEDMEDMEDVLKRVSMGLSVWRETSKKLTVCREKGKKLTVCRELFLFR